MKFTYQELQEKQGEKVGQFRGYPVYCASIHSYLHSYNHEGCAYLIYNDNNMLVVGEQAIGRIKVNGAINYFGTPIDYDRYLTTKDLPDLEEQNQQVKVETTPSKNLLVETSQIPTKTPSFVDFDIDKFAVNVNLSSSELVESLLNSVFDN